MYGAILGDIIGSPFEFDRGDKTKNFDLFSEGCGFTDDSVMTIAVGEALLAVGPDAAVKEIEEVIVSNMQDWGGRYPHAGYGGRFRHWLKEKNPKPYGSYGNGSAMRVSAAGWLYDSMERTREVARATANVTHNHQEGIKGAEATASAIYMARNGSSKEEIKEYIEGEFNYNLDRTLDEIRPEYHMDETCQRTVPEAIIAFLESKDFEDAVRNAVSLGGDTDTLGAITGSIAERLYLWNTLEYNLQSNVPVLIEILDKRFLSMNKGKRISVSYQGRLRYESYINDIKKIDSNKWEWMIAYKVFDKDKLINRIESPMYWTYNSIESILEELHDIHFRGVKLSESLLLAKKI